ncbi:MAG TPA: ATP-binding cassette domain-containing protein [Actinomycetota bacterium]|nr:ATP-binding cassette domain-containing protein [Actinomycetota bacterium]
MINALRSSFFQLWQAVREAGGEARKEWNRKTSVVAAALVAAALLPFVIRDPVRLAAMGSALYTVLAAVGVNFAVGMAGIPSLGHGAFVAVGAFTVALLRTEAGWDPSLATLAGVVLAGVAGVLVGAGAIRLARPIVAIATWVIAWLVTFTLAAFPGLFGGLQGLPVPEGTLGIGSVGLVVRLTPGVHYEVAVVLVAAALAAFFVLSRAPWGLALAASRDAPAAAASVGVEQGRLQFHTFTGSAMLCGLAGALAVQLAGVADPTAYGPLLSVELFAAVLLGGVGRPLGPVVGAAGLLLIPRVAQGLGAIAGLEAERFEPAVASLLVVAALVIGRGGILGWTDSVRARLGRRRPDGAEASRRTPTGLEPNQDAVPDTWRRILTEPRLNSSRAAGRGPLLQATGLQKRFGGLLALDGADLHVAPGEVHGLIGPNGSGKTTLLRLLGGTLRADNGRILFAGHDLTESPTSARIRAGLIRTLQRVTLCPSLRVRENVVVGATTRRRYGGGVRSLTLTPLARAEAKAMDGEADALLSLVGLEEAAERYPRELSGTEQRLVMVAAACAAFPRLLLLDEPSAGMSHAELVRLVDIIGQLRSEGVAVVLVEHNLRLVRLLADRVTVLDAGRIVAEGTPDEISRDQAVVQAYLGPRGM